MCLLFNLALQNLNPYNKFWQSQSLAQCLVQSPPRAFVFSRWWHRDVTWWWCDGEAEQPISLLVQLMGREATDCPAPTIWPFIGTETLINNMRKTGLSPTCCSCARRDPGQGTYTEKQVDLNVGHKREWLGGKKKPKINFPSLSRDCCKYCMWR